MATGGGRGLRAGIDWYQWDLPPHARFVALLAVSLLHSKIQQKLGGRVRIIFSGSAPLSAEVAFFLRVCFGCSLVEGYGLTECCAAGSVTLPWNTTYGDVGQVCAVRSRRRASYVGYLLFSICLSRRTSRSHAHLRPCSHSLVSSSSLSTCPTWATGAQITLPVARSGCLP